MGTFIIYATLLINGMVSVIEYKKESFETDTACIKYLQQNNSHINQTLKEHLDKTNRSSAVLFIGCSERNKFQQDTGV
jgi:3-deoxy-D-manno-octulosonic acid (KDO) 8-phosphate synthase